MVTGADAGLVGKLAALRALGVTSYEGTEGKFTFGDKPAAPSIDPTKVPFDAATAAKIEPPTDSLEWVMGGHHPPLEDPETELVKSRS